MSKIKKSDLETKRGQQITSNASLEAFLAEHSRIMGEDSGGGGGGGGKDTDESRSSARLTLVSGERIIGRTEKGIKQQKTRRKNKIKRKSKRMKTSSNKTM
eukprot:jgi/Bigna1/137602/aug1.40_g12310